MKNINILSAATCLLLALYSCNNKPAKTDKAPVQEAQKTNPKLDEQAEKLSGTWLSDEYFTRIEKSRSIYSNRDFNTHMLGFKISKDSLEGHRPYLSGFTDHEGGMDAALAYSPAKDRFENDMTLSKEFTGLLVPFTLNPFNDNKLEIAFEKPAEKEIYRKAISLNTELRRILFEGTYIDKATNNTITFNQNGTTAGIGTKHFYELMFDFEDIHFDTVFIADNANRENQKLYHFKIESNTLKLFEVNETEETGNTIGKLVYNLVKK